MHDSAAYAFVEQAKMRLAEVLGADDDARLRSADLGRIVSHHHTARGKRLLDDACAKGARVAFGGEVREDQPYIAATLLEQVPTSAAVMQEEIFGLLLLPILRFRELDKVVERINAREKPLALYIWSRDKARARAILDRTSSGSACVNKIVVHALDPLLPFGGVNHSGIGSTHGEFGFRSFSHARAVANTLIPLTQLFYPPYTECVKSLIRLVMRWLA